MSISNTLKTTINKNNLFSTGDHIIIAVSGGSDSTALAILLNDIKHEIGIQLTIAHYNHNLRRCSQKDQQCVKQLAKSLNLPFVTETWKKSEQSKKGSLEEYARKKRFKFLIKTAKRNKTRIIALAHHKNDIAETVLMRILRGSGLQGLQTILPKRKIENFLFIRPLCNALQADLEIFIKKRKIRFVTDPSNKNTDFLRNKTRLNLIPYLQKNYSSNIIELLSNLSNTASIDYNYLETQCIHTFSQKANVAKNKKSIHFDLKDFVQLHPALIRMLIRHSILTLKGNTNRLTFKQIENIENLCLRRVKRSQVSLPHNISVEIHSNSLTILKSQ